MVNLKSTKHEEASTHFWVCVSNKNGSFKDTVISNYFFLNNPVKEMSNNKINSFTQDLSCCIL